MSIQILRNYAITFSVAKIMFVAAEITFIVAVITSSLDKISLFGPRSPFCSGRDIFLKVSVITSSVAKIKLQWVR